MKVSPSPFEELSIPNVTPILPQRDLQPFPREREILKSLRDDSIWALRTTLIFEELKLHSGLPSRVLSRLRIKIFLKAITQKTRWVKNSQWSFLIPECVVETDILAYWMNPTCTFCLRGKTSYGRQDPLEVFRTAPPLWSTCTRIITK